MKGSIPPPTVSPPSDNVEHCGDTFWRSDVAGGISGMCPVTTEAGLSAARQKKIGLIPVLAFAVGAMVGGGVFVLSGTAINKAGPGALVSYAIAGIIVLLSSIGFVAVAARAKVGDSGYGPVADLLGRPWRFLVMWGFYLNAVFGIAFLADAFGSYLHTYFVGGIGALEAGIGSIVVLVVLNLGPAVWVGRAETWIVSIKVGLLLLFIGYGVTAFKPVHFEPFASHGSGPIFATTALLFTAYSGFNVVTSMAPRVRNPSRTVPVAVISAVLISLGLYVLVGIGMLDSGISNFGSAGVGQAADVLMGGWGGKVIAFAACLSTLSGANAMLMGGSENMLRLVAQQDVPHFLGKTTKSGFPWMSVVLIGIVTLFLISFTSILTIIVIGSITVLAALLIMNIAAVVLARRKFPGTGFRIPGGATIPLFAVGACVWQLTYYSVVDLVAATICLALGLAVYLVQHHRARQNRASRFTNEVLADIRKAFHHTETPLAQALLHPFHPHRWFHDRSS
jgi:APA family basic amino acid/polyamine antiporter